MPVLRDAGRTRICRAYSRLCSLQNTALFRDVYNRGIHAADRRIVLHVKENGLDMNRLGVSVSKKNGNSVVRHRFIRLVKEVFRLHNNELVQGRDLVVSAKRSFIMEHPADLTYADIERALERLFVRARLYGTPDNDRQK